MELGPALLLLLLLLLPSCVAGAISWSFPVADEMKEDGTGSEDEEEADCVLTLAERESAVDSGLLS